MPETEVFLPSNLLNNTAQGIREITETLDWSEVELRALYDFADFIETEAHISGIDEYHIIEAFFDKERKGLVVEIPS